MSSSILPARTPGIRVAQQLDHYEGLTSLSPEHVVYAGSTSKSLAPGLRLGWLVLPSSLVDAVVDAKRRADRGTDILTQLALAELIEAGDLDRHIRRMRRRYRYRRDALVQTLNECAPAVTVHGVAAGLHTVIQLPDAISEAEFCRSADDNFVALTGLTPFWHNTTHGSTGIVIGFGAPFDHDYTRALDALGQLVSNVVATHIGNAQ